MRSAARLTYEEAQAAHDGPHILPVAAYRLDALYGAFAALDRARIARGALALDLIEYRVVLDAANTPVAVEPRRRLDSHKLIEEFMILANVAAAEELEARRRPSLYRVHDEPAADRLDALRLALADIDVPGLALAKGQVIRPELFNRVLERVVGRAEAPVVNDLVLRAQAQAAYSPDNIGHFGLALRRYAHFTSPIRRYADLLRIARRSARACRRTSWMRWESMSRRPSGGPPRRSAPRLSATARGFSAAGLARFSPAGSTASSAMGCSSPSPTAAPTGCCRSPTCRPISTASIRRRCG